MKKGSTIQFFMKSNTLLVKVFQLLFLSAAFFQMSVSSVAADSSPLCGGFKVTHQPTSSDPSIKISIDSETITDTRSYYVLYKSDSKSHASGVFAKGDLPKDITLTPENSIEELSGQVHFVPYPSDSPFYCSLSIVYDEGGVIVEPGTPQVFNLCKQAGVNINTCNQCLIKKQIWTGMGCIPFGTSGGMVRALMTIGLGITGSIVVIMTLYAGFMFSTSQGDPKRVDEAKGAMTSAIIGAFFIIFSVTILQFIGVTILKIPSFG